MKKISRTFFIFSGLLISLKTVVLINTYSDNLDELLLLPHLQCLLWKYMITKTDVIMSRIDFQKQSIIQSIKQTSNVVFL